MWEVPCHFVGPLSTMFLYASYSTLACIALDRCLVVIYGIRYKAMVTTSVIKVEVALSWALSAILAFLGPKAFGIAKNIYTFYPPESMCVVVEKQVMQSDSVHEAAQTGHKTIRDEHFSIMESILSMYLPFLILMTSSVLLMVLLRKRKTGGRSAMVDRSCRTVLMMVSGYLVCSTPYAMTLVCDSISPEAYLVFRFLLQVHCIFTPIIYISRDSNFRRAVSGKKYSYASAGPQSSSGSVLGNLFERIKDKHPSFTKITNQNEESTITVSR